eukprot:jgi/Antlo1/1624/1836
MEEYEGGFIQSSPKREFTGVRTLRNLTVAQINKIETEDSSTIYKIDNAEVTNIVFIGWVRESKQTQTGTIFTVEDGTGSARCTFWPNSLVEEEQAGFIAVGNLLRLVGSLRLYDGKKSIHTTHLSVVEDYNYISFHFLSCVQQHLHYTNRLRGGTMKEEKMSRILEDVLECFRCNQDENGLHVDIVVRMLSNKYQEKDVKAAVDTLLNDCHLFSVEGQEYKTTI